MDTRNESICLWSGFAFMPLYMLGFVFVAGFIPPPSPALGANEIAAFLDGNRWSILAGMMICVIACGLYVPWSVAIFGQMLRVEKGRIAAFSYVQLGSGILSTNYFMIPPLFWIAMAYRPGHAPDLLLLLNDFNWLAWLVTWPPFFVQNISVGLCALMYRSTILPRWLGYLSIWSSVSMIAMSFMAFVYSGPFAWNGLFGLYLPIFIYFIWYLAMFVVLRKAIKDRSPVVPQGSASMPA